VEIAVRNITDGLIRVDPEGASYYTDNRDRYLSEVKATFEQLREKLRPFQGTAVLQYHPSWDYFCLTFGLNIVGSLEPKPGIPPTPAHLEEIVKQAKAAKARLLLVEPYYPERPVHFVERETGVKALRLSLYLGGKDGAATYLDNLRYLVSSIANALQTG